MSLLFTLYEEGARMHISVFFSPPFTQQVFDRLQNYSFRLFHAGSASLLVNLQDSIYTPANHYAGFHECRRPSGCCIPCLDCFSQVHER